MSNFRMSFFHGSFHSRPLAIELPSALLDARRLTFSDRTGFANLLPLLPQAHPYLIAAEQRRHAKEEVAELDLLKPIAISSVNALQFRNAQTQQIRAEARRCDIEGLCKSQTARDQSIWFPLLQL
jgi:hypothetical protein